MDAKEFPFSSWVLKSLDNPSPPPTDYTYGKIPDHRRGFIHSVGEGFILGGAYGYVVPLLRGFHSSPSGARLAARAQHVLRNTPRHAGWVAVWSVVVFSVDTAMSLARRKEDIWNSLAGGSVALASLNMHQGTRAAALCGAAVVAVPLGIIWYASKWHNHIMSSSDTQKIISIPGRGLHGFFRDENPSNTSERKIKVCLPFEFRV
jgi:import inner membrane translocase subunit TIM17